jgi:hypothetical protein
MAATLASGRRVRAEDWKLLVKADTIMDYL